jgi:hypothetical protein
MWNDWSKDAGYGVHTDKAIADAWSATIATRYAPEQVEEVVSVLHGNADKTIENDNFVLAYTFSKGPAIDERLITITAK